MYWAKPNFKRAPEILRIGNLFSCRRIFSQWRQMFICGVYDFILYFAQGWKFGMSIFSFTVKSPFPFPVDAPGIGVQSLQQPLLNGGYVGGSTLFSLWYWRSAFSVACGKFAAHCGYASAVCSAALCSWESLLGNWRVETMVEMPVAICGREASCQRPGRSRPCGSRPLGNPRAGKVCFGKAPGPSQKPTTTPMMKGQPPTDPTPPQSRGFARVRPGGAGPAAAAQVGGCPWVR